ncbi:MAG TPA: hypothetical protein VF418_00760 [Sphingomonadaceae bacterium]
MARKNWVTIFLGKLAETSNVKAAAEAADVSQSLVYKRRRDDRDFARQWYAALAEGYDNLEMELLGVLRAGKPEEVDADGTRHKFDIGSALRCLIAHREAVAKEKGRRTLADEAATIESINAKIDAIRAKEERAAKLEAKQARRQSDGK